MDLVFGIALPTTPADAGFTQVLGEEFARIARQKTPNGGLTATYAYSYVADLAGHSAPTVEAGDGLVDVTWEEYLGDDLVGYIVEVADADGDPIAVTGDEARAVAAGTETLEFDGLTNDTEYTFKVYVVIQVRLPTPSAFSAGVTPVA